jgi:methionine-gamma-lyase
MYSLTKYVGGHSDLVAGGIVGAKALVQPIRQLRSALGSQLDPNSAWMIMRSMETLSLRMHRASANASKVAYFLQDHAKIERVNYLGFIAPEDRRSSVFKQQCGSAGSTFSFYVKGGEAEAFRFLDSLKIIKLAVSLGSTESLAQHPAAMTHSGLTPEAKKASGVSDDLVRISIGIENPDDLIWDLKQALDQM